MAILLILVLSGTLGLLPPSGYVPLFEDPLGWASHMVMPSVTIGLVSGAILTRFIRAAVLESLEQDHVRTARSKGLREGLVLRRHVLRNALIPIITSAGSYLPYVFLGSLVFESAERRLAPWRHE